MFDDYMMDSLYKKIERHNPVIILYMEVTSVKGRCNSFSASWVGEQQNSWLKFPFSFIVSG